MKHSKSVESLPNFQWQAPCTNLNPRIEDFLATLLSPCSAKVEQITLVLQFFFSYKNAIRSKANVTFQI